ncbi:MAG: GNAT family N-acetyltransferase [Alphaproteobacteria bacterium]
MIAPLDFRLDDLSGEAIRALVSRHLSGMHEHTPAESVHALGLEKLRHSSIRLWSAWQGAGLVGMGALRRIDATNGELKSMRVADAYLGQGIGRGILDHLIADARALGMTRLWLETGSGAPFVPATALYESAGFARCAPFDYYKPDPFSVFMTKHLPSEAGEGDR